MVSKRYGFIKCHQDWRKLQQFLRTIDQATQRVNYEIFCICIHTLHFDAIQAEYNWNNLKCIELAHPHHT